MKRNITSLLVLAAFAQAPMFAQPLFAQEEQPQGSNALSVEEMRQSLVRSTYDLNAVQAELVRVKQQVTKENAEFKKRMMLAIEEELKAKLTAELVQNRYLEITETNQQLKQQALSEKEAHAARELNLKRLTAELEANLEDAQKVDSRKESDLKTAIYVARYAEGYMLADLASKAFGHLVTYTEVGTIYGRGRVNSRQRFTSVPTGNQVLVTDFPDQLSKALELLVEIDASCSGNKADLFVSPEPRIVVYAPKAWTFSQVRALISSDSGDRSERLTVTEIPNSPKIRIEGSEAKVAQALQLLQASDVFPAQVRLRAWLIHTNGATPHPGVALPKDLVLGLEGALPGQHFFGLASMLIQTSVGHHKQVSAVTLLPNPSMEFPIHEWTFTTGMRSYDSDSGVLALEQCSFNVEFQSNTERLSADLLLRKDEFTVVGSIQGGSMFLVLTYEEI